jgi:lipopolysaccharide/colanic/teichoic acid biosynthesis glycosyltransferase
MVRRPTDILLALVGLAVASPVLLAIAVAVRLQDGAPVIYRARRVGQHGREFRLFKFRTMVASGGSSVTVWKDPRVTPLGRRLRRLKLDELPQLFNVLRGEMSIVGPRPEDPSYVALYTEEQRRVLSVKPGITGVAALAYADEESLLQGEDWEETYRLTIMPAKLQLELDYLAKRSPRTDAELILQTVAVVAGHLVPRR